MDTIKPEVTTTEFTLSQEQANAFHALAACPETKHEFADVTRIIYGGQAGGGKSTLISLYLDGMAKQYEATRYYMARERLKDIKESILLTFFDVMRITGSRFKYNDLRGIITYPNGSQIYLVDIFHYPSDPNYDTLGSREYTGGAIEEGITVAKRGADILLSRTRYKHDIYDLTPKQLITCNPGPGWIKDDIVVPYLEGNGRHNEIFIRATLDSNPNKAFAAAYRKTLHENLTAFDRARLLYGDWNAHPKTGSEYLRSYNPDVHVAPVDYDGDLALHLSFDENVHPYITCGIFQIDMRPGWKIVKQIDEICLRPPLNSRRRVCNEVIRRYGDHRSGMFVYGDATSLKSETSQEYGENFFTEILSYLQQFSPSLRVPRKNPSVVAKGTFLNKILESNYANIKLIVGGKCVDSNSDYSYTIEDSDGGILKKKVRDPETGISYELNGHHVDMLSYFVCYAFSGEYTRHLAGNIPHVYEIGTDRDYKFNR